MRCRLLVLLFGFLAVASPSIAQKGSHAGSGRSHRDSSHQPTVSQPNVTKPPATPAAPKHHGTIKRSNAVTAAFMKPAGHPHGWPGHVVDHLKPPPAAARTRRATCCGRRPRKRRLRTRSNEWGAPDGEGGTEEAPTARGRGGRRLRPWLHPGDGYDVEDEPVDPPEWCTRIPPTEETPCSCRPRVSPRDRPARPIRGLRDRQRWAKPVKPVKRKPGGQ